MTLEKYTIKAQSVIQEAVNIAQRNAQQSIEPIHLLKQLLKKLATSPTLYSKN